MKFTYLHKISIGVVLVFVLAYQFAIKNTFQEKQRLNELQKEQQLVNNIPKQIQNLSDTKKKYQEVYSNFRKGRSFDDNSLINRINEFKNDATIEIVEFTEPLFYEDKGIKYINYKFTVSGSFNDLINLIYTIEHVERYGLILHIDMYKKKLPKSKEEKLYCEIVLKSYQFNT